MQYAGAGLDVGPDVRIPRGEIESGERDPLGPHFEPAAGLFDREPAALLECQLPDLQGDVAAPVAERIEREFKPGDLDILRVESCRRVVSPYAVGDLVLCQCNLPDPDGPGLCGWLRLGLNLRCRLLRFRPLRKGQVGAGAAVQPEACDADLLPAQLHPARIGSCLAHLYGEPPDVGCGLHFERSVPDGDCREADRPRLGGRRVGFLDAFAASRTQERPGIVERDPPDGRLPGAQIGRNPFHIQTSGRQPHAEPRHGVPVAGRETFDPERPDDGLFAQQGPRIDVETDPSAVDQRVAAVDQPHLLDREPQGKCQPQPSDGELHAEGLRDRADGLVQGKLLHGRHVQQDDADQRKRQQDEECAERIFEESFHDGPKTREFSCKVQKADE